MAVTDRDVRHIADLARLGLDPARVDALVRELNGILDHVEVLSAVDITKVEREDAAAAALAGLRPDVGPPLPLDRPRDAFAPEMRDGFFLVPRLATHDSRDDDGDPA